MTRLALTLLLAAASPAPAASLAPQAPPCRDGYSRATADALGLTRAQWDAACAGKTVPQARAKEVAAPAATRTHAGPAARWRVYDVHGKEVLRYRDEGGLLRSTASGGGSRTHPFISGSALEPAAEDALRTALEASRDAADFRTRLQKAGFLVLPDDAPAPVPPGSSWEVLKKGRPVLRVRNTPGLLISRASPGMGEPARHRFLSASSLDASEEDALRTVLDQSRSTADFLRRLELAGYSVRRLP